EAFPGPPDDSQTSLIQHILSAGWDDQAKPLLSYLYSCQPMLKEIRSGAALDYARPTPMRGPTTPVPNLLAVQVAAKLLCVEARQLEASRKAAEALRRTT